MTHFSDQAPGNLVPTTANERFTLGGFPSVRQARGQAFVPHPLPPAGDPAPVVGSVADVLSSASLALGRLQGLAAEVSIARVLAAPLMRREASVSSRIEDTIATPEEVALFETGHQAQKSDTIEVANYRRALWHGINSDLPICVRLVNEMHAILLGGVRGDDKSPGRVRELQNWIGGDPSNLASARFVPPPPGEPLQRCLKELEDNWNYGLKGWPTLVVIALCHYQFEAIHPYADGNGRLGRLLVVLSLVRSGLLTEPLVYISGYFDLHRREYYDRLLDVSVNGAWPEWIRFFLTAVADQATDAAGRLTRIKAERQRVHHELARDKAPAAMLPLVDHLIERLAVDASGTKELLGVTDPTARNYLRRLEDIGFLTPVRPGNYGQVWVARSILSIIDDAIAAQ
ncbi:MAG TPA: cell filamentation protein Fic [Phycisphaerales bacterium]|nr:cell filamentation protein Fic [Phycisphaerales bacterium]